MVVGTMLINSKTVQAQPKTMDDGTVFDAEHYAQKYADVVSVYGTEEKSLYKHYAQFGIAENREAVAAPDKNTFDAEYYAKQNPDVVAVYGTGDNSLYQHYLAYGKKEGRKPTASAVNAGKSDTSQSVPEIQEKVPSEEEEATKPKGISDEEARNLFLNLINNKDDMLFALVPEGTFEFFDVNKDSTIDQQESVEMIMWLTDKYNDSNKGELSPTETSIMGQALYNGTFELPSSWYFVQR